jgi:hypothetical protein
VVTCGAVVALAACGGSTSTSSSSIPKVSIAATASGYDIQPAGQLPAGLIEFDLHNNDSALHEFKFASPVAGTTLDQLRATLSSGNLDQLPQKVELGFSWVLPPAGSQTLFLTFAASTNFVLSLISRGPNAPVQAAQGYLAQFTVSGAPAKGQPQPTTGGTLAISANAVNVPTGFGKGTYVMVNTDSVAAHRLTFYRFTGPAKPLADVVAAFAQQAQAANGPAPPTGPPPQLTLGLQGIGGPDPFPPFGCSCIIGSQVLGTFNLSPGTYVAFGDGIDPKTNMFEASAGLAAEFTVS